MNAPIDLTALSRQLAIIRRASEQPRPEVAEAEEVLDLTPYLEITRLLRGNGPQTD